MRTSHTFSSLLLLSSALIAPSAIAQTSEQTEPAPAATTPPPAEDEQVEVSVPGASFDGEIVVTGRYIPNIVRATPQVVSVLSNEEIERAGDGDIAGALQRVTGLSVVGNGYVYVRGLGDRYSLALLNGSPLPSPEPLKRVVPLDLFPTSIVGSALVQKTYSANYPGEFGGGVINLTTKALPDEPFLKLGFGMSGDSETTGQLGYTYYGGDFDFLGYDDGTRSIRGPLKAALNSGKLITEGADFSARDIHDIAASLSNASTSLLQRNNNIPVNFSADLSAGSRWDIGGNRLGFIAAAGFSNNWSTRDAVQQLSGGFTEGRLDPNVNFRAVRTDNRIVVNGLLGLGFEFGEHKLRWTNLYIHDTLKQSRLSTGFDTEGLGDNTRVMKQDTNWVERQLIDTQFVGEFKFDDLSVDIRGTYANTKRDAPYERSFSYVFDDSIGDYVNNLRAAGQNARIVFSELNEDVYAGAIDLGYKLPTSMNITVHGGYAYTSTKRDASRREFRFVPADELPIPVTQQRPDYLLSDFNIYTYDIQLTETSGQAGAAAYEAGLDIHAGYGQVEAEVGPGVTLIAGVRYESAKQHVTPVDLFGIGTGGVTSTRLNNSYWLPAATVTWNFAEDMQLRLNASKTIARPQFRELAFQIYQDTESDRQFFGNPFLVDSKLFNAEARYEWFFGKGERFTLAGFYKKIDNPIEAFAFRSTGQLQTSFANAPEAQLYGAEVEVLKYVPLSGVSESPFFASRRLVFVANYTYSKSKINVGADDNIVFANGGVLPAADFFRDGAPLTGQSEHVGNLQIGIEDQDKLSQQTLLLTYASERVTNRGPSGTPQQPDIKEKPGIRLDFVARQGITLLGTEIELKFEARNLTGTRYQEFQQAGDSRIDVNTYKVGRSFSIGAELKF
ncbi:MAG: TonB-dependent receptor [Sphingomonas sp. SCN 67-18]|uniref:TonB-dependent receptor domain-containing protein n=1 Tax=uncultured Sphingomonas sp. TaxID=158754 RepID=UPI00086CE65A|nr:TonB-dependent receptor [Sphingomonas sp. SCN 67-18]ODU21887.1 MAG: TonB-dependent receptor [Sphingomonas sp. SCN 67-18]